MKNPLRNLYKEAFSFIKESKKFIYIIIGIFVLFGLIGFFFPVPENVSQQILNLLQELISKTKEMNQGELILFIFFNNLKTSFMGLLLGIFLGIYPIIISLTNGYLIGFVSKISVEHQGFLSLWKLLPHGIFELPAVFISLSLGLHAGIVLLKKKKQHSIKEFIRKMILTFILIIIPLLIIAAIIEGVLIAQIKV